MGYMCSPHLQLRGEKLHGPWGTLLPLANRHPSAGWAEPGFTLEVCFLAGALWFLLTLGDRVRVVGPTPGRKTNSASNFTFQESVCWAWLGRWTCGQAGYPGENNRARDAISFTDHTAAPRQRAFEN